VARLHGRQREQADRDRGDGDDRPAYCPVTRMCHQEQARLGEHHEPGEVVGRDSDRGEDGPPHEPAPRRILAREQERDEGHAADQREQ
jgi:hypothetical protein